MLSEYELAGRRFLRKYHMSFSATATEYEYDEELRGDRQWYRCRLTHKPTRKGFSVKFGQSINGTERGEVPTAYDVIACVYSDLSYVDLDFDDFCRELGYSDDSRKAEHIHKAVVKQGRRLRAFLDVVTAHEEVPDDEIEDDMYRVSNGDAIPPKAADGTEGEA